MVKKSTLKKDNSLSNEIIWKALWSFNENSIENIVSRVIASWEIYTTKLKDFESSFWVKKGNWDVDIYYSKRNSFNSDIDWIENEIVKNLSVYFSWTTTNDSSFTHFLSKKINKND